MTVILKKTLFLKKCFFISFIFLSILNFQIALSSDSTKVKSTVWEDFASDSKIIFNDGGRYYSSPFRFDKTDWLITLAGAGATFGIMELDEDVKKSASVHNGNSKTGFWAVVRGYGEIKYWAPASILTYSTGLFIRNEDVRVLGRMLIQSLLYSGLLTSTIKVITGRTRPYNTDNQFQFNWFESNNDNLSFPSGHSSIAFAVSSVFAEKIDTWWARVGFYSIAGLTAYSRIYDTQHWLSDVVVGSLIGFSSGYFTVHQENRREEISKYAKELSSDERKIDKEIKNKLKHSDILSHMIFYPALNGFSFEYDF